MATTEQDQLREAIRRTLADHVGGTPDAASAVATATLSIWQQVTTLLVPVIGEKGVYVLFRRSLHLTLSAFPWLAIAGGDYKESAALLASLKARLADHTPEVAAEASYNLLVTFTELLTTLIGESLTARLLDPVWVSTPAAAAKESES